MDLRMSPSYQRGTILSSYKASANYSIMAGRDLADDQLQHVSVLPLLTVPAGFASLIRKIYISQLQDAFF